MLSFQTKYVRFEDPRAKKIGLKECMYINTVYRTVFSEKIRKLTLILPTKLPYSSQVFSIH